MKSHGSQPGSGIDWRATAELTQAVAELTRAPAALTVVGDTIAGAASSGHALRGRGRALPAASVAFYWSGMALNDWADRQVDALERPERPIPSRRIAPGAALATAAALTAAGLSLAAVGGSPRTGLVLACAIWAYDGVLKGGPAAPLGMAVCRSADVLLGARPGGVGSARAATALGVHTLGVTALSRGEVRGGSRSAVAAALAGTAAACALTVAGGSDEPRRSAATGAWALLYALWVGRPQLAAASKPTAGRVRAATAAGIHGMVPLQAGLICRRGSVRTAALLAAALPSARALARLVSPT